MKINKLFKNITITSVLFGAMVLNGTTSSKAVLQSNGNTGATYNLNDWMVNVRKMEELGGAMGLSETLNSNLTASSDSNNIDVHMQKNTEYGALAILSASSYGNPNKINDGETTTGNVTGAVMKLNSEWVAAGNLSSVTNCANAVSRYKNYEEGNVTYKDYYYYLDYTKRNGDAITETYGWYGSSNSRWINVGYWISGSNAKSTITSIGLLRATSNSIFSYYGYGGMTDGYNGGMHDKVGSHSEMEHTTRAVIVQGEGV
ncbi:MAG: hypothetical protein V8R82_07260 [Clostridia bacterium]